MADAAVDFDVFDVMGQFTDTVAGDVRDPYPDALGQAAATRRSSGAGRRAYEPDEAYVVYRYDDVADVLRDNETLLARRRSAS